MEKVEIVDAATAIKAGGGAFRIAEKDYHADPCPSPSQSRSIAKMLISAAPAKAWWAHPQLNPEWRPDPGTKRTALGSACHCKLSGVDEDSIVEIDADSYRTNAAKAARDDAYANGQTPLLSRDIERAEKIVAAARRQLREEQDLDIYASNEGDAEIVVAVETLTGWKRIKIDWWSGDRIVVIDYKTIDGSVALAPFSRRASQMDYDFQDAFYTNTIAEAFPFLAGRTRFVFVAQEIDPPYLLAARELAESDRTVAMRKVVEADRIWFECTESGKWPGYTNGIERFTMPGWHNNAWLERELMEDET